ncbi:non-canonical purine NTP pyrophosphatase [Oceanobacillus manasiensis]|uniref:non-canonical purine NTP pyrophosphatase n=1 Tax=Oceanobacillus manasiensis TaxID=586413 RepID=UPI0005A83B7C|nr:non-canonical purine NTP pyrophosphatase [Oceanobacillus manasiensis]
MKIVVATWNEAKLEQIQKAFKSIPLKIIALPNNVGDVEETAPTFTGNAQLKTEAIKSNFPNDIIVGEDSGLIVDSLEGFPGVKTARFAPGNDADRARILIQKLAGVSLSNRTAAFESVVAVAFPDGEVLYSQGSMKGWIRESVRSSLKGYGDIFLLSNEKTLSEHVSQNTTPFDHRQIALFQAKQHILEWLGRATG